MRKDFEPTESLNLNLDLKPFGQDLPGKFKIRRIIQNYRVTGATVTSESVHLLTYFDRHNLSGAARSYVLDLLQNAQELNPEATINDLRGNLEKAIPAELSDRPEIREAIGILFR